MAAKKAENLSKLSFKELKDKAKEIEGAAAMNRFEMTMAVCQAENVPVCPELEKANPRAVKPEIEALKKKLAETPKADKAARKSLRRNVAKLKKVTRRYL